MSKPKILKTIITGEGGVGKTTLLHRYIEGKFLIDTRMTIGVEFFLKELNIDTEKYYYKYGTLEVKIVSDFFLEIMQKAQKAQYSCLILQDLKP